MKQADKSSRRVPEERAATIEEVVAAYEELTRQELLRLERYARRLVSGLGRAARGRDWEDLLGQAIADTYEGKRRWNKAAVDFLGHLFGVMRSTASHWRDQFDADEALSESDATHISPEGKVTNPLLEAASPGADPERELEAKQEVERIEGIASKNPLAWLIMDGWRGGMTGPEIREALEVSQKDYETALKWLRRNVGPKTDKEGRDD